MRSMKKFGVLFVALCALSAIGAGSASAAFFTANAAGELTGTATNTHIFLTNAGEIRCNQAHATGKITATQQTSQHVTVDYGTNCTAFGLGGVHITPATYNFLVNGHVELLNTITITVTLGGCSVHVPATQTLTSVSYSNSGANHILVNAGVGGIEYKGSGGLCGSSNLKDGTYTGASTVARVGGGTLRWDP